MTSWLVLSKDVALQDLIAFTPLLVVGVLAFAAAMLFVIKRRISQMAAMITLSGIFGFVAAIIDFVRVVELSNAIRHESRLAAIVVREMILSVSITLRFLFFWHVVALPARTEVARPLLPSRLNGSSFLTEPEMHSGSWTRWGIVGLVLKYFMLTSVVAIGVLEAVWRLEYAFDFNALAAVTSASATLEIAVTTIFTLKLLGNLLFTSAELRRGVIVDYIPILLALALSLGLAVGNLIIYRFSEYPMGRLLQGLETYILITYTLVVAFDDVGAPTMTNGPISKRAREAESFSAVRVPALEALLPITPKRPTFSVSLRNEQSSAERLASWVSRRLSGRPEPESLPLWSQRDVEAVGIDGTGTSSVARSRGENSKSNSVASYYFGEEDLKRSASLEKNPRKPRSMVAALPYDDIPPVPTVPFSRLMAGTESPIYGLNGVVDEHRPDMEIVIDSPYSDAIAAPTLAIPPAVTEEGNASPSNSTLRRAQENLARSVAGLKLQDPSLKTQRISTSISEGSERSAESAFTLKRFPVPPRGNHRISLSSQMSTSPGAEVDGVAFDMIPPRIPETSRQNSFPSTTRGSGISSLGAVRISSSTTNARRYEGREITSFIGGAMNENEAVSTRSENGPSNLPSQTPRASIRGLRTRQPRPYNNSISNSPLQQSPLRRESDTSVALPLKPRPAAHQPSSSLDLSPSRRPRALSPEEISRLTRRPSDPPRFESPRPAPAITPTPKSRPPDRN